MYPVIHAYKLRLTNLSQGNRSLKLGTLSPRKDLDITTAAFLNKLGSEEILTRIVSGRPVDLIKALNPRDEATALADRRLNHLFHEVGTIHEETGAYDLHLGYPWVEGRFNDGSIARCPLVLFPVALRRDFEGGTRWRVEIPEDASPAPNRTFFLALEKFMQIRLPQGFWEEEWDHHEDLQAFLNHLYKLLNDHSIPISFNSNLFQFKVAAFEDKNAAALDLLPTGVLKLQPHAVMGIFPQSDSALLQDYDLLERSPERFQLERLMRMQPPAPPAPAPKEDERFLVTPVDQSQEEVLMQARAGQSMVVHGPPGTGKSQVILNLIADALAQGKRVLVCSQKRAALDVVHQRLQETGLGEHAALVHDFRADRPRIFAQIRAQIEALDEQRRNPADLGQEKWLRDFRLDARRIDELTQHFDRLHQALTRVTRFGISAHQAYLLARAGTSGPALGRTALSLDYAAMRQLMERLSDLRGYLDLIHPAHPWRHRLPFHAHSLGSRQALLEKVQALPTELDALHAAWQPCLPLGLPHHPSADLRACLQEWQALAALLDQPGIADGHAAHLADGRNMTPVRKDLDRFAKLAADMGAFKLLHSFPLSAFDDLHAHVEAYTAQLGKPFRFLSLSWLRARWYLLRLLKPQGLKLDKATWRQLQSEHETLSKFLSHWREQQGRAFMEDLPLLEGPDAVIAWAAAKHAALDASKAAQAYKGPAALRPRTQGPRFDGQAWAQSSALAAALGAFLHARASTEAAWSRLLHPAQAAPLLATIHRPEGATQHIQALADTLRRDHERLRDLDAFLHTWTTHERALLDTLWPSLEACAQGSPFDTLLHATENAILNAWIEVMEDEAPILTETSSSRMDTSRRAYADKIQARQESAAALIRARLRAHVLDAEEYNRLGNPVTYREIARQVNKQRRVWPLRKLVAETWEEGLARLMPCWLASPESISAIFPMEPGFFDLVVFDEASQCYVERALPVMLRGKVVVVAGDDQQLQPFDLYNVKVEDTEEAFLENEMAMEVESALDLGKNVFPEYKLMWHYRSHEERLIRFSNHSFYGGRLNVMPSAKPDIGYLPPIEFIAVQGLWEQNRNLPEAEAVVALLERLVQLPDQPSIGVVTFNHPQMELIRGLLEQRLDSLQLAFNPELRQKLRAAMDPPEGSGRQGLFVKNIENVQGDERDIIVFSVGYARNASGRLVANFGLLNQRGGGNRLNVAVTRARRKVFVCCSFDPDVLEVGQALHEGPRLLKRYLQFAREVSEGASEPLPPQRPQGSGHVPLPEDSLACMVAARLRAAGLDVEEAVGGTSYRIDLAVRDGKGGYRLGIECEGPGYFGGKSAKEREVYRRRMLERNGWRIHRVWARSYFLDPEAEVARIMSALDETL